MWITNDMDDAIRFLRNRLRKASAMKYSSNPNPFEYEEGKWANHGKRSNKGHGNKRLKNRQARKAKNKRNKR